MVLFTSVYSQSPEIHVDLDHEVGDMKPIWAWFGYDEPNYTYMKDGKKLLSEIAALSPVPVFVRTHNLLSTGDGTASLKWGSTNAYTEDANGNPVYSWTIVDSIFDTYIKRGMKPLAQIGFMPEALSTNPQPYQHSWKPGASYKEVFTGWAYPPKDYNKWRELIYQWANHCVERYGKKEVESWWWEVWNEPNIGYWQGTVEEYCKLYDYAADGLRKALPTARIGGCDITGGGSKFLSAFIEHCLSDTNYATHKIGSPLDLILFHAKGQPKVINETVVMNVGTSSMVLPGMPLIIDAKCESALYTIILLIIILLKVPFAESAAGPRILPANRKKIGAFTISRIVIFEMVTSSSMAPSTDSKASPLQNSKTQLVIVIFLNPPFDSVPNLILPVGPSWSGTLFHSFLL